MAGKTKKTAGGSEEPSGYRLVAGNRKAAHLYHLEDRLEAGVALLGTEVKALRGGKASIMEAFGRMRGGELWLFNMDIPAYEMRGYATHEPKRPRKLLVHKRELRRIQRALVERGYTLVPLSLYFNHRGIVKTQIALARGKKLFDRREDVKRRDARRDVDRELARRRKKR